MVVSGKLAGGHADGVFVYLGIPYAAPPIGALRWRPSQPPAAWTGVRDATRFANDCMQVYAAPPSLDSGRTQAPGMSEDCLYLNVWTPVDETGARLPVYVWFHGGSFVRGSAAEPVYDGAAMARRGIVVVSVNYRLGAFGFFAHPALTGASGNAASGNYALLDAIAALRWIRNNIESFGGDPAQVVVGGQSAGGAIVGNLLVSPLAEGLFQRAVAMSPGSFRPLGELREAEQYGMRAGNDIDALRRFTAAQVLALNTSYVPKARGLTTPRMLRPIVDGWVIPEQETTLFLAGKFANVPLLVGGCADEGSLLAIGSRMDTLEAYVAFMRLNFGARADEALALYAAHSDAEVARAYAAALGDSQFHYAARSMARVFAKAQPNTYRYLFTRKIGSTARPAGHCDELSYVFGTLEEGSKTLNLRPPNEAERATQQVMQETWVRFIATGDPNGGAIKNWPRYRPGTDDVLQFGETTHVIRNPRGANMDLLDRTYGLHVSLDVRIPD